jgi:hypothetical protein
MAHSTCTKQTALDNSEVHMSLQISPFWHIEFKGGFHVYGKFVGHCIMLLCRENLVFLERTFSCHISVICSSRPEHLFMLHHISCFTRLVSFSYFILCLLQV